MFFEPRPRRRGRPQLRISERRALLRMGDVLATVIAVLVALLIWSLVDRRRPYNLAFILEQSYWLIILPGLWLFLATANDFYDLQMAASRASALARLLIITLQLLVIYLIIFFLSPRGALPRLFIAYYGGVSFVLIALWRLLFRPSVMDWASERRRALVVGAEWGSMMIVQAIRDYAPEQYQITGIIGPQEALGEDIGGVKIIGTGTDLLDLARQHNVVELIVATPCELSGAMFQGVMDCYQQGISIVPVAILYERLTGRVPVEYVGKDWAIVLPIETASIFDPYPVLKRLIDIALSLIGLSIFALLLPFIALATTINSPGPIFFGQVRVGQGGRHFRVIKLRSMIPNAEATTGAVFAGKHDSRITRVGRFLRKSRLDEVPQLWNVLKGEMSLIGPRPERPEFIDELTEEIPFYRARLAVKPGVTGWAQVRHDYVDSLQGHLTKLQYDLYYIRHQSVILDLQIIFRTAWKMLSFAGQ